MPKKEKIERARQLGRMGEALIAETSLDKLGPNAVIEIVIGVTIGVLDTCLEALTIDPENQRAIQLGNYLSEYVMLMVDMHDAPEER